MNKIIIILIIFTLFAFLFFKEKFTSNKIAVILHVGNINVFKEIVKDYPKFFKFDLYISCNNQNDYDMAREINLRVYLSLDDVLRVHQYTYERRYNHSKSDKNPTYWEYRLYGGDEGRKWASDIVRLYLPNKWKPA